MPFAARRRHQYWTSDVRYIDHELGGRAYVVSVRSTTGATSF